MAKLEFGKIIGGVGAGALVHLLEQRYGDSTQLTNPSNIVPILLAEIWATYYIKWWRLKNLSKKCKPS